MESPVVTKSSITRNNRMAPTINCKVLNGFLLSGTFGYVRFREIF
jgi:hypothetical protein